MKKLLLILSVIAATQVNAQMNLERDLVGTWSVVDVGRLMIPPNAGVDPTKVDEARSILKSARFEFGDDHRLRVETSEPAMLGVDDGYWVAKGNRVAVGRWADQGQNLGTLTMGVQERDGKVYFVVEGVAELEVRKD